MYSLSGSYASIGHVVSDTILSQGDIVLYDGHYLWKGRVVGATPTYIMLMDRHGRLCRFIRQSGRTYLLSRREEDESWVVSVEAAIIAVESMLLLQREGVREAIIAAMHAPSDPANYDQWLLPLDLFAHDAPLGLAAQRYLTWPAPMRRKFEATFSFMKGPRQREVLLECVLGARPARELQELHGLRSAAIRTARWRAKNLLRLYVGEPLE